jgi:aspartate/methionine/tyrosine aminotransferase
MTDRAMRSEYMHWAKFKPPARYSLAGSEVPHVRMDRLKWTIRDLDLDGASHPRYLPLREAIGRRYDVPAEMVVTADGTSMANMLALAALVERGEEVLVEHPVYEPLMQAVKFVGATVNRFERRPQDGFALQPEVIDAAMTSATRLLVLTNLHNPSGTLTGEDDLCAIGQLAAARGARILIDEVYLDAVTPRPRSCVHLGPQFVATSSLTKVYGLSGLRCGWILAEPELAERIWRLNDLFVVNRAHADERLGCIAFDHIDAVLGESPAPLRRNRAVFNAFLSGRGDLVCTPALHGLTAFPRWSGGDTERLAAHLHDRYDTAIVPGHWFEMPEHFRVGFGEPADDFAEGLSRLGTALDDLK